MANLDLSKYGITDVKEVLHNPSYDVLFAEERAEKKAAKKSSGKREEAPASIQNQAASTTLGDIDALAALKEQMEAGKK